MFVRAAGRLSARALKHGDYAPPAAAVKRRASSAILVSTQHVWRTCAANIRPGESPFDFTSKLAPQRSSWITARSLKMAQGDGQRTSPSLDQWDCPACPRNKSIWPTNFAPEAQKCSFLLTLFSFSRMEFLDPWQVRSRFQKQSVCSSVVETDSYTFFGRATRSQRHESTITPVTPGSHRLSSTTCFWCLELNVSGPA